MCWQEKWSKIHGLIVLLINWWIGCWEPKLPKVVKVNHLAHIHPLARKALQSAKQRQAAKTNTCRSPGRLFVRGHLHGSRLTGQRARACERDKSRVRHSWTEFRTRREEGRRCYRSRCRALKSQRCLQNAWEGPGSLQEMFSFRRLRLSIWKWSDYDIGCERKSPEGQRWECMVAKVSWCFLTLETLYPLWLVLIGLTGRESNSWTWEDVVSFSCMGTFNINWLEKQPEKRRFCLF